VKLRLGEDGRSVLDDDAAYRAVRERQVEAHVTTKPLGEEADPVVERVSDAPERVCVPLHERGDGVSALLGHDEDVVGLFEVSRG
jgi:hypothetical protein